MSAPGKMYSIILRVVSKPIPFKKTSFRMLSYRTKVWKSIELTFH